MNTQLAKCQDSAIRCGLLLTLLLFTACGQRDEAPKAIVLRPEPFDPMSLQMPNADLEKGRDIWMDTCSTCHLAGLTGAPPIGDHEAWRPRIAKGKATLFDHAINGFIGPTYTEMPPKGGFAELSDEHVKLAADFMIFASRSASLSLDLPNPPPTTPHD